jgi:cytochrome d ubiquinol oxidase subunit II
MDLQMIWFGLIGVLFIGYALLDGFDLGVGIISLFARDNRERGIAMRAIAPVWDGNEVWLLTAGGALFAAFPPVYAGVFSGFYGALMLLLAALILRAVSLEFHGKVESGTWRRIWGLSFGVGSLVVALLLGVAFGNILRGIPINQDGDFVGTFWSLLNPYALLVGILAVVAFVMHGAAYMMLKTDGEFRTRMRRWAVSGWVASVILYIIASWASVVGAPHLFAGLTSKPLFYPALAVVLAGLASFPMMIRANRHMGVFAASGAIIAGMLGVAGISMYPGIVHSTLSAAHTLTAQNASSSQYTLRVMTIVAVLAIPPMLAYTGYVYWVFKGKIGEEGY